MIKSLVDFWVNQINFGWIFLDLTYARIGSIESWADISNQDAPKNVSYKTDESLAFRQWGNMAYVFLVGSTSWSPHNMTHLYFHLHCIFISCQVNWKVIFSPHITLNLVGNSIFNINKYIYFVIITMKGDIQFKINTQHIKIIINA